MKAESHKAEKPASESKDRMVLLPCFEVASHGLDLLLHPIPSEIPSFWQCPSNL